MTAHRTRTAPLLVALALSLLAHAVTLSGGWLHLPQTPADAPPLMVRLQSAAPAPVAAPVVPPVSRARAAPTPRAPSIAAAPAPLVLDAPAPWSLPLLDAEPATQPDAPEWVAQPEPAAPSEPEPVVIASAAPSTFTPEPAIIKTLPRRGRISYDLNYYMSNLPTIVGRTVQTWASEGNTYKLDSLSETVGLARLTRFGPRIYHSNGIITERGLLPQSFTSKVVVSGKADDSTAQFDWDKSILQFGRVAYQENTALPAGSQDLLSFMYQLSLAPPARGRLKIPVTTGVRFENYELEVFDEETLETPLGPLRVLPVRQVRVQGSESIEVWLAADYHYLPVRIRFIGRDGTPGGEQIATEISISNQ